MNRLCTPRIVEGQRSGKCVPGAGEVHIHSSRAACEGHHPIPARSDSTITGDGTCHVRRRSRTVVEETGDRPGVHGDRTIQINCSLRGETPAMVRAEGQGS